MTTTHNQVRSSRRQHAPGKSVRPALIQRHSHPKPHHRPNSSRGKTEITVEEEEHVEDDPMAAAFPQFCTVCNHQILIPSSVLYCSERCRKQDSGDSSSYALFKSDVVTPGGSSVTTPPAPFENNDIIPKLSPTISVKQPFDPTQLPPETSPSDTESVSSSLCGRRKRPSPNRRESEAARYLAQFQSPDRPSSRAGYGRSAGNTTPGLSLTPTSATSASMPFTPLSSASAQGPQPLRNPRWSASAFSNRSVDLITPITQCTTAPSSLTTITDKFAEIRMDESSSATPRAVDQLSYEKRSPIPGSALSPGQSSLKQLFKFDEMRGSPSVDRS